MMPDKKFDKDTLLAEYQAAIAGFHHYDTFRWDAGSLIVAGSLVLLGLLFSYEEIDATTLSVTSIFITVLLSRWLLFAYHYRQLYMSKALRMHELEKHLGMKLNRRLGFIGTEVELKIFGTKGHEIDTQIFVLMSLFGPVLIALTFGIYDPWVLASLVASLIIVDRTVRTVKKQENDMMNALKNISEL